MTHLFESIRCSWTLVTEGVKKNCFRAKANCQVSIEELINAINVDSTCPRVNHDL